MRRIIITDYTDTVTLLPDLEISITPQDISKQAEMGSGRTVEDVIGMKHNLKIPVGYLPVEDVRKLEKMIVRNAKVLTISYPAVDGDRTERFIVTPPTYTTFAYDENGVAIWKGVTINALSVGVVK